MIPLLRLLSPSKPLGSSTTARCTSYRLLSRTWLLVPALLRSLQSLQSEIYPNSDCSATVRSPLTHMLCGFQPGLAALQKRCKSSLRKR